MKKKINEKIMLVILISVVTFLSACTTQPIKAPCDQYASFCGTKTKINQW